MAAIKSYVTATGKNVVETWLRSIKDVTTRLRIVQRIDRLGQSNAGDSKSLGGGLNELRIPIGPGFRVYFWKHGNEYVLLLCAGDKASQSSDFPRARGYLKEYLEREKHNARQS